MLRGLAAAWGVYTAGLAVLLAQLLRRCRGGFRAPVLPPQPGRVAVVTGGAEGLGLSTARQLARLGMTVVIAGINEDKAQAAVRKIREETANDRVEFLYCDLASLASIRQFVENFKKKKIPLHVLINNAGVMLAPRSPTADGFERHLGVNFLGHFALTSLLLDALSGAPGRCARVVTVASATHYVASLDPDDLQGSRGYSAHGAYASSKMALVLFTYRLQRLMRVRGLRATASAADPGVVDTDLYRHVCWPVRLAKRLCGRLLFKTPDEGAWTSVYAAASPELEGRGGLYLRDEEAARSLPATYDLELQERLWAESCRLTGVPDVAATVL